MNRVDLTTGFTLYLGAALLSLLVAAFVHQLRRRRCCFVGSRKGVITCEFCAKEYLDREGRELTTCPQCHSLNR